MTLEKMLKNDREKLDIVGLSINRKELEYSIYIVTHRSNIKYAYIKYRDIIIKTLTLSDEEIASLDTRIYKHDLSKLSTEEYDAYRMHFYPIEEEKEFTENDEDFERAWAHHFSINDHHWEYYKTIYGCAKMPREAIAEMVLDWIAMSMNPGNSKSYVYYEKNKNNIKLHEITRVQLEAVLQAVKEFDITLGDK